MKQSLDQLKAEEEDLLKQCGELEELLRRDPLSFENETLEVQLQQIQADHGQLREELRSTREFRDQTPEVLIFFVGVHPFLHPQKIRKSFAG